MVDPYTELLADVGDEQAALDDVVASLPPAAWELPTPAERWAVRDQVWHLTYFDGQACRAVTDPDGFTADLAGLITDVQGWEARIVSEGQGPSAGELLMLWRDGRHDLLRVLGTLDRTARLPWYGPPMSAMSFATARLMETWAHGQDVVDGVHAAGWPAERPPTDRLRHISHLGVRTRGFSYAVRGGVAPSADVRVELVAPSGDTWTWGAAGAADRVRGSALDFCLTVTQRRNVADTDLEVIGPAASEWMSIAQCFAGGPSPARPPASP